MGGGGVGGCLMYILYSTTVDEERSQRGLDEEDVKEVERKV
jgi:hypothetical protein